MRAAVNSIIISNVSLIENYTHILAATNIVLIYDSYPPKAAKIKEIIWHPPLIFWTKCNSDGAAHGSPDNAVCGGAFKDYQANFLFCRLLCFPYWYFFCSPC